MLTRPSETHGPQSAKSPLSLPGCGGMCSSSSLNVSYFLTCLKPGSSLRSLLPPQALPKPSPVEDLLYLTSLLPLILRVENVSPSSLLLPNLHASLINNHNDIYRNKCIFGSIILFLAHNPRMFIMSPGKYPFIC